MLQLSVTSADSQQPFDLCHHDFVTSCSLNCVFSDISLPGTDSQLYNMDRHVYFKRDAPFAYHVITRPRRDGYETISLQSISTVSQQHLAPFFSIKFERADGTGGVCRLMRRSQATPKISVVIIWLKHTGPQKYGSRQMELLNRATPDYRTEAANVFPFWEKCVHNFVGTPVFSFFFYFVRTGNN